MIPEAQKIVDLVTTQLSEDKERLEEQILNGRCRTFEEYRAACASRQTIKVAIDTVNEAAKQAGVETAE